MTVYWQCTMDFLNTGQNLYRAKLHIQDIFFWYNHERVQGPGARGQERAKIGTIPCYRIPSSARWKLNTFMCMRAGMRFPLNTYLTIHLAIYLRYRFAQSPPEVLSSTVNLSVIFRASMLSLRPAFSSQYCVF